jgi:pyruvate kinase
MAQTKIVATIGPASSSPEVLGQLVEAGASVLRLNFSHGEHEQHARVIETARRVSEEKGRPLALLQDLSGPKIRTRTVAGGAIELKTGSRLAITTEKVEGNAERISTTYELLPDDVSSGDTILLDDGNLELRVRGVSGREVECEVVQGGQLRSRKGMNLPGVKLSTPAITDKDREDLRFGVAQGVDYIALSFVRAASDVVECRRLIEAEGARIPVIAKIEKREAVQDLGAILEESAGLMVARGDLGVELSTEEVPTLQKQIIGAANAVGKPVITATQMLESMVHSNRPTRAEASDVANAILDGSDAIMLSAETAAGAHPVESVRTMARIAHHTERNFRLRRAERLKLPGAQAARSLARVATEIVEELSCRLIVAFTESGTTARLVAAFRPPVPIVGLTYDPGTLRRLSLVWGVTPMLSHHVDSVEQMIRDAEGLLLETKMVAKGDKVLMLIGHRHEVGATNALRIHTVS